MVNLTYNASFSQLNKYMNNGIKFQLCQHLCQQSLMATNQSAIIFIEQIIIQIPIVTQLNYYVDLACFASLPSSPQLLCFMIFSLSIMAQPTNQQNREILSEYKLQYNLIQQPKKEDPMLPSNTEKKNLIEAMKKLTYQISNNAQRQKQIFDSLASNDLIKIVHNLYDDNQYLRRISALLLCELFYNNTPLKLALVEKLSLPLAYGRVCLNRMPDSVLKNPSDVRKCLELMKSPVRKGRSRITSGEDGMFCWAINLDKKNIDLQIYEFKKYSSFTFLDPQRTIFGFTMLDSEREHDVPLSPATQSMESTLKTQRRQSSKDSKLESQLVAKRYSINKRIQSIRPNTTATSRDKQYILSGSKQKTYSFIRQPHQIHHQTYRNPTLSSNQSSNNNSNSVLSTGKSKLGTSIQSISQYARNSYGRQTGDRFRDKQKQRERYSLSYSNNQAGFQSTQLHTDRLADRFQSKNSTQMQNSVGKIRTNSKTPQNHHQNFYKRVQEILRK